MLLSYDIAPKNKLLFRELKLFIPKECVSDEIQRFDKFVVERIKTVNKRIVGLSIINLSLKTDNPKDKRCFVWKKEVAENG